MDTFGKLSMNLPHSGEAARGLRQADPKPTSPLRTSERSRSASDYAALACGRPARPPTSRPTPPQRRNNSCPRSAPASAWQRSSSSRQASSLSPTPVVRDTTPHIQTGAYFWILTSSRRATGRLRRAQKKLGALITLTTQDHTHWTWIHVNFTIRIFPNADTHRPSRLRTSEQSLLKKKTPPVGPKLHSCRCAVSHPQQLAGTLPEAWTITPQYDLS
jgi:hypothetical protein